MAKVSENSQKIIKLVFYTAITPYYPARNHIYDFIYFYRSPFKIHPYVCSEEDGQTRYCCFDAPSIPSDPSTISTFPKCGQKLYHSGQDLSVARHSEYPWMAAIFVKYHFVCTGALIHPSVVLTAAHYIHR